MSTYTHTMVSPNRGDTRSRVQPYEADEFIGVVELGSRVTIQSRFPDELQALGEVLLRVAGEMREAKARAAVAREAVPS